MDDSRLADLDPTSLILDKTLQARDTELIKDKRLRSAQEIKQASQDEQILNDLRNGQPIRQRVTVFVIDDKYFVVDGFHRTKACLNYLKENPKTTIFIPCLVIENRTYQEAFEAAQEANQGHGVGITEDERGQAKFRQLIVNGNFSLSVSQIAEKVSCSRGQANHISRGLKACKEALGDIAGQDIHDLAGYIEQLQSGLETKYCLPKNAWDAQGFPKIRKLSDAISGKDFIKDMDNEEWQNHQISSVSEKITNIIKNFGEDHFREGLRQAVKGNALGVSISRRNKWLEQVGSIDSNEAPDDWERAKVEIIEYDDF